ncbi:MAG TPA: helix-turn-helix transcriptional regulator [Gammaproteobacteria bacterium]|nr:helix-turn-helix transcriptional regulator [Gammaproteobacteria bacterium]
MTSADIAKTVRYYRKQSGLSQLQLARLSGVGKTAVFDVEQGKETVQFNTLLKILDTLNIQIKLNTPFPQTTEINS